MKDSNQIDKKARADKIYDCRSGAHKVGRCEQISRLTSSNREKRFAEAGYEGKKTV